MSDFKDLSPMVETNAPLLQQQQSRKGGPHLLFPELKGSDIVQHMLAKGGVSSNQQQLRRQGGPITASSSSQQQQQQQQLRNAVEYKKTTGQCFFVVELIDPQVNFLDVKTHSSLIIVAGHSSLEGRRSAQAWTSTRYAQPACLLACLRASA